MNGEGRFEPRIHPPYLPEERDEIAAFRRAAGLGPDGELEGKGAEPYTVCLLESGRLAAVGSLAGRTIRGLAVAAGERGEGLASRVVSELEAEAARRGVEPLLVFTSPGRREAFESLGYRALAEAPGAALLLEKGGGLETWLRTTAAALPPARSRTALVMNCNPFTLGHRRLVEAASASSEAVVVLVVGEDASAFPFEVRLRLVREGTAEFGNVAVVPGGPYIVSKATFPTYFLKEPGEAARIHARLDVELFGRRIAPALGIGRRMVGEEPLDPLTAIYNETMLGVLPPLGVGVEVIPRLALRGGAVSASAVRRLVAEGRLAEACALLPESTKAWLASDEAASTIERVRREAGSARPK